MTQHEAPARHWLHLRPDGGIDDVCVTTSDGDRFMLSVDEAIASCRFGDQLRQFIEQVGGVTDRLDAWLLQHRGKIDRAYLHIGRDGLDFIAVQRGMAMDPEIQDSLTELDLEIAHNQAFDLIRMDVTALPYCSENASSSFVPREGTRVKKFRE